MEPAHRSRDYIRCSARDSLDTRYFRHRHDFTVDNVHTGCCFLFHVLDVLRFNQPLAMWHGHPSHPQAQETIHEGCLRERVGWPKQKDIPHHACATSHNSCQTEPHQIEAYDSLCQCEPYPFQSNPNENVK